MATRAQQSDLLLAGIADESTGLAASGWWISFHEAGNSIGVAGALTNTKNAYNDKDKTGAITVKELNAYGAAQVYMDGVYKVAVWNANGDPSSDATAVVKFEYDNVKYDFGVGGTVTKTGDYTATTDDALVLVDTSGGNVTITLPVASTVTNPINIKKISSDANTVTVAAQGGDQIDNSDTSSFASPYFTLQATSDGSNWWGTASLTDASTLQGFAPSQTSAASAVVVAEADGKLDPDWIDKTELAGVGLSANGDALDVNVDDATIEIDTDTLRLIDFTYTASAGGYLVNTPLYELSSGIVVLHTYTMDSATPVKVLEYKCQLPGTLYSSFELQMSAGSGYGRIYINGSAVGTEHTGAPAWATKVDASLTVSKGDLIQLYLYESTSTIAVGARNWEIKSSTGRLPLYQTYADSLPDQP